MKNLLKRISAALLALLTALSVLSVSITAAPSNSQIITAPTGYTSASDVVYVKNDNIIANWGARGEDCVFLSTYASDYYTGQYSFAALSALTGGTNQSDASSSALFSELQELMESTHTFYTYYDGNKNVRKYYMYTDCISSDTSQVALFYRGGLETSVWNSGNIWNQEHMWPQSKLSSSEQIGDIMHLRPSNPSENSSRGNDSYGIGSSYYDPGVSVRGDCARIALYMYVRWGKTNMWGTSGVIQNVDVLLDWMEEDPVDTWEMGRNDAVQSITGTRNVFVDYPEFAWLLFGLDVPAEITTPSGNDGVAANPGGNTPPPVTQPPATQPPVTQPPVSDPSGDTTPPTSQPSTSQNTQTSNPSSTPSSTPATKPTQPAPMATTPVNPDDFIPKDDNSGHPVLHVLAIVGSVLAVASVVVYFVVIKPKKTVPVSDATPAEESNEEFPSEDSE